MNAHHSPGSAVSDADLIRYLDGELDADESERIETAIAGDDTVAGRLAALSRRDRNLRALLGAVDPSADETRGADPVRRMAEASNGTVGADPVRRMAEASDGTPGADPVRRLAEASGAEGIISRGGVEARESAEVLSIEGARRARADRIPHAPAGTRWLKAAIVVFALLGAGMLVPPVRAWIVDRLESLVAGTDVDVDTSPAMPSTDEGAAVAYGIPVTGSVLDVTLAGPQAAGALIVEAADLVDARIEPLGAGAGDPVVVTPDAVRIDNDAAATGGYRLSVPRSVTTVRVRFGTGDAQLHDVGAEPLTIPLTGAGD